MFEIQRPSTCIIFLPYPKNTLIYKQKIGAIAFIASQWYGSDMKREIWINKANSFEDAQEFDTAYYLNLSSAERVETVQVLREAHFKLNGLFRRENGKRLRRVLRVIKQK